MDQSKIGAFIAVLRKEKGITQAQLAEYMDVSNRAVSKWEHGQNLPDSGRLLQLCDYFGITVNELLKGERIEQTEFKEKTEIYSTDSILNKGIIKKITSGIVYFDIALNIICIILVIKFSLWFRTIPLLLFFLFFDIKYIINRINDINSDSIIDIISISSFIKGILLIIITVLAIVLGINELVTSLL